MRVCGCAAFGVVAGFVIVLFVGAGLSEFFDAPLIKSI